MKEKKNRNNLFWGIGFLLVSVFIVLYYFGFIGEEINIFKLICASFLGIIIIKSIIKINFVGIFFPVAFLCILFEHEWNLSRFVPIPALFAALFASIGFTIIFPKKYGIFYRNIKRENFTEILDKEDGSEVVCNVSFGGMTKYVNSKDLKKAIIRCSFGGASVYFDKAIIKDSDAHIHLDVSFGGVELYLPHNWNVIIDANVSLGSVDEKGKPQWQEGAPNVYITGNVSLSGVEIIYI